MLCSIIPLPIAFADTTELTVCYNFGCKTHGYIRPTQSDTDTLGKLFHNVASATDERRNISLAIATMESIAARSLPTGNDLGGNYTPGMIEEGKQDCIDESINTTTYLRFFQQMDWLRWHTVGKRVHRAPYFFDGHWAAQIQEKVTGAIYIVDSWYRDNGQPPVIQTLDAWKDKQDPDI
jgi:hypothetical protein